MPIGFRDYEFVSHATSIDFTPANLTGVQEGDLYVVVIGCPAASDTITPPAGWTQVENASGSGLRIAMYTLPVPETPPTTYSFAVTSTGTPDGIFAAYQASAHHKDSHGTQLESSSATVTLPTVTVQDPESWIIGATYNDSLFTITKPTEMTERANESTAGSVLCLFDEQPGAGSWSGRQASTTGATAWGSVSCEIRHQGSSAHRGAQPDDTPGGIGLV